MKPDSKLEETYKKILKECIALIALENQKEREKIAVALEIGKKLAELPNNGFDKEKIFKRLTRDIFRARHKAVSLSKIAEYHQLYLDFGSMEAINSMEKMLLTDITMGTLSQIAGNYKSGKGSSELRQVNPLLEILQKVRRLLDRLKVMLDNYDLSDTNPVALNCTIDGLQVKLQEISKTVESEGNGGQMRLFGDSPDIVSTVPYTANIHHKFSEVGDPK